MAATKTRATDTEILAELESLGSEQARKTYRRHGVGENQFGVSYSALGKLKKRIKTDHELALKLWESGNHDARILATMIADPQQAEEIVASGKADMVALARGFLDDPHWGWHAAKALGAEVARPPQYERAGPKLWAPAAAKI